MRVKTPSFWYRNQAEPAPAIEKALRPLSCLYAGAHTLNQSLGTPQSVSVPIICVGNIVAGGAGKTIAAQSLMALINDENLKQTPFFLTRGYGGQKKGTFKVDAAQHDYFDCGDEALLLAKHAPTIISKDRYKGALHAQNNGADLILMDDGMQNRSLKKDLNIMVISGNMGFGNKRLLPAGPLREPLEAGLNKADAFILIGEDKHGVLETLPEKPIFTAKFSSENKSRPPKDNAYIAFAGLGYPDKFFDYLKTDLKYELCKQISFPDHYPYTEKDLHRLKNMAKEADAELITTEKDYIRLPRSLDFKIHTLPVTLDWSDKSAVIEFLKTHLTA